MIEILCSLTSQEYILKTSLFLLPFPSVLLAKPLVFWTVIYKTKVLFNVLQMVTFFLHSTLEIFSLFF